MIKIPLVHEPNHSVQVKSIFSELPCSLGFLIMPDDRYYESY